MAIAGTLGVNILALADKFVSGIDKASKRLEKFEKRTSKADKAMGAFQRQIAATIGIAGMGRFIMRTTETLDEINKMSTQLGISGEALQFQAFVAERASVSFQTFTMSMQRMERRLGEVARLGKSEAAPALEQLNLNAKELVKLDPAEQYFRIVEALQGIGNHNETMAIMGKIFDSEGIKSTTRVMAENIGQLREDFEKMGGAVSQRGLNQATEFVDAMTNLKRSGAVLGQKVVIDVAPALTKVVEFLAAAAAEAEEEGRILGEKSAEAARKQKFRPRTPPQFLGTAAGVGGVIPSPRRRVIGRRVQADPETTRQAQFRDPERFRTAGAGSAFLRIANDTRTQMLQAQQQLFEAQRQTQISEQMREELIEIKRELSEEKTRRIVWEQARSLD